MLSRGIWRLSLRHLAHHRGRSGILVACLAIVMFLPVTAQLLVARHRADLEERAAATPLVAGAKGNAFGLTLAALYFRSERVEPIPLGLAAEFTADGHATAIPLHARFTAAGGHPVVATVPEYFELRGLRPAAGTLPLRIGDAVLGAGVARDLGLTPGDRILSDTGVLHDLAQPTALRMTVVGVLAETGAADDRAVFASLETAWILEGFAHGHEDVRTMGDQDVQARTDDVVAVAPSAFQYAEVTDENAHTFHHHGDDATFPLTAIVLLPASERSRVILKTRINRQSDLWRVVVPTEVVAELMEEVLRVKRLFDAVALVLAVVTVLMLVLQLVLSAQLRRGERLTLERIGCSPGAVRSLHGTEILTLVALAAAAAAILVWGAVATVPNLVLHW